MKRTTWMLAAALIAMGTSLAHAQPADPNCLDPNCFDPNWPVCDPNCGDPNGATPAERLGESGLEATVPRTFAITGFLTVRNLSPYYVNVYANDGSVGTIAPFSSGSVFLGDILGTMTCLEAFAPGTSMSWHTDVFGDYDHYTWTIYE